MREPPNECARELLGSALELGARCPLDAAASDQDLALIAALYLMGALMLALVLVLVDVDSSPRWRP